MYSVCEVDILITLCKILNRFDSLCNDFIYSYNFDNLYNHVEFLERNVNGEAHDKFYMDLYGIHKEELDFINKEIGIKRFFCSAYEYDGYMNNNFKIMYRYIKSNKNNVDKILELLNKIKGLGINTVILDNYHMFNCYKYTINKDFASNRVINYVTDVELESTYNNEFTYKSNNDDFILTLFISDGEFYYSSSHIVVSNLLFDGSILPDKIDMECFNKIINSLSETDRKNKIIINVNEINVIIERIKNILCRIDKDSETYKKLYNEVCNLEVIRDEYFNSINNDNKNILSL